jgi:hypothetical protein
MPDTVAGMDEAPDGERGRYFAYRTGPQSMLIARATGLCDRCANCGCGEQQEPIDLSPAGIMKLIGRGDFQLPGPAELIKMARGRNGGG